MCVPFLLTDDSFEWFTFFAGVTTEATLGGVLVIDSEALALAATIVLSRFRFRDIRRHGRGLYVAPTRNI